MRLFVAIELPGQLRHALSEVHRNIRASTHSARWVAPESIHLTLKFLGEVKESSINAIKDVLADITWQPFTVTVRGLGFFPAKRSPRIFWAGMEAPTLVELAAEIDKRLEKLGFEKEKRAFHPHVTLARAKGDRMEPELVAALSSLENHEFGSFVADRFLLFQSTLSGAGAIYTKLREYTFNQ
jgi:2'-5' RNA ligase